MTRAVLVPRSTSKSMTADFSQKEFVHLNGKPGRVHLRNLTLPTSWKFQMPPVPPRALEVIQANGSSWKLIVIKVAPNIPNTRGGTCLIKWLNDQFPSLVAIIYIQWIGAIMVIGSCIQQLSQLGSWRSAPSLDSPFPPHRTTLILGSFSKTYNRTRNSNPKCYKACYCWLIRLAISLILSSTPVK